MASIGGVDELLTIVRIRLPFAAAAIKEFAVAETGLEGALTQEVLQGQFRPRELIRNLAIGAQKVAIGQVVPNLIEFLCGCRRVKLRLHRANESAEATNV